MADNNLSVNVYWNNGRSVKFMNDNGDVIAELKDFVMLSSKDWKNTQDLLSSLGANVIVKDGAP